jgi:hypothetical protein
LAPPPWRIKIRTEKKEPGDGGNGGTHEKERATVEKGVQEKPPERHRRRCQWKKRKKWRLRKRKTKKRSGESGREVEKNAREIMEKEWRKNEVEAISALLMVGH